MSGTNDWSIITARNPQTGEGAVFRARFAKPDRSDMASLVWAIVIQWPYESEGEDAMPSATVSEQQQRFEDALEPLTASAQSELMHVSTGMGLKEWIFYARDSDPFMQQLNALLAGHPAYPIGIEFFDDPDWEVWEQMVQDLRR